jgi:hypothetical protein
MLEVANLKGVNICAFPHPSSKGILYIIHKLHYSYFSKQNIMMVTWPVAGQSTAFATTSLSQSGTPSPKKLSR